MNEEIEIINEAPPSMIIGIGCDIVDIRRIEEMLAKYGDTFTDRILSKEETAYLNQHDQYKAKYVAKFFAAKEAAYKALDADVEACCSWQDFCVIHSGLEAPSLIIRGNAKQHLCRRFSILIDPLVYLSLSETYPYMQAFAIIKAQKNQPN